MVIDFQGRFLIQHLKVKCSSSKPANANPIPSTETLNIRELDNNDVFST